MSIKEVLKVGMQTKVTETFASLNELYTYLCETPFNDAFRWESHHSVSGNKNFTHTNNFEEAVELFKHGWEDMSIKLETKLKVMEKQMAPGTKVRSTYDMAGFQCSVPRYLQGVPTSMINKKRVPQKQKVVTLNKDISYHCGISTNQIIESSLKSLMVVKKLEQQGYRVNLNIIWGLKDYAQQNGTHIVVKIRIKSASERLNISKVAFPLCHPSMLRRLLFRYVEVCPEITKSFVDGYGIPKNPEELVIKNEYLLPKLVDDVDEVIKGLKLK